MDQGRGLKEYWKQAILLEKPSEKSLRAVKV
jgi:hypothetical protein